MTSNSTAGSKKRGRDADEADQDSPNHSKGAQHEDGSSTTNFRNVSACNRCRTRKNRCDQKLPRCGGCEKANVKCVGFDPVSKRAIPRSYVYYLETRVRGLELLLRDHGIEFPPPSEDFSISEAIQPGRNVPFPVLDEDPHAAGGAVGGNYDGSGSALDPALHQWDDHEKLKQLVSDVGMVSVQGASDRSSIGSASGISFARVVFAAVKSSVSQAPSEKGQMRPSKGLPTGIDEGGTSMRDSFFGLHTKPTIKPAPFPDKAIGERLIELYFEYANPQIPILHRVEFYSLFERVYATEQKKRTARELYLLNIVFAIGSGIIMDSNADRTLTTTESMVNDDTPASKRQRLESKQHQPEEYHSSAVVHLESFLSSSPAAEVSSGGLEELQAVLLLASLALLRPVAPGLWYIVGVAVRLAVDLGLHSEEIDPQLDSHIVDLDSDSSRSIGRRQFTRDLRRRLWWCVYALDRLVSTCVGRPFGITDVVVTTEFPSLLEDRFITTDGFLKRPLSAELPSYKVIARHYLRLRLLQSEIVQVLQFRQAEKARVLGANQANDYVHKNLVSPFMHNFDSFRDWRLDVDRRLGEWKDSAPKQADAGVAFTPLFLELNYWQAIILLYRQSLAVPDQLAGELSPSTGSDVQSPGTIEREGYEDQQRVFMKIAQAGQMTLKLYRQLHRLKLVNYTFLATHHLFMSGKLLSMRHVIARLTCSQGVSFLYSIWHSTLVRSQLSLDDVDFTVLIATSVLNDLIGKCPPAEACRDAFARMSKATIAMVEKSGGFGAHSTLSSQPLKSDRDYFDAKHVKPHKRKLTMPKFDMNLRDLFDEAEIVNRPTQQPRQFNSNSSQPMMNEAASTSMPPISTNMQSPVYQRASPPMNMYGAPPQHTPTLSNQQPYVPLAETISQTQPDFSFDDMSFLDTFPVSDPTPGSWGGWGAPGATNDLDLGFGTGGTGSYDANGNWDMNGIDLFGGLFFGNDGGSSF